MTSILNAILVALENGEMTDSMANDPSPSIITKVIGLLLLLVFLRAFGVIGR